MPKITKLVSNESRTRTGAMSFQSLCVYHDGAAKCGEMKEMPSLEGYKLSHGVVGNRD